MNKLNLVFLRNFNDRDKEKLIVSLKEYYNIFFPDQSPNQSPNQNHNLAEADVLVNNQVTEETLSLAKRVKLFQVPGAGLNLLDLSLFQNRNIVVCNSHSNSYYVAEHAMALLLTTIKKVSLMDQKMRINKVQSQPSQTLRNKTVAILGYGPIGRTLEKMFSGFSCKILIYRKHPKEENQINDIDKICKEADIIMSALPLTKDTNSIIAEEQFAIMKSNAVIVNISRGKIINQEVLYLALKNNRIAGAGIDVWYDDYKSESPNFDFKQLDNIVLSPYRAGHVDNAPHLDEAIENLIAFARGEELKNKVDLEKGY